MPLPTVLQTLLDQHGHLGFIPVPLRNAAQEAAHDAAARKMVQFHGLPDQPMKIGQSLKLFEFWKHPDVVADVGFQFDRIHQLTGSCVWAGGTNALFTTIAVQRVATDNPTKAFLPFTLHNYACSRHAFGDDGQGEGSLGSTFADSLVAEGVRDWLSNQEGMPAYNDEDGVMVTSQLELLWSSYRSQVVKDMLIKQLAKLGAAAPCRTVADISAMTTNGYGISFACDRYIGNASVKGTGDKARVMGKWDGNGGHQQYIFGKEMHPDFGPIYAVGNNWPRSTYPQDQSGLPICSCYVLESDVAAALNYHAEVYGLSHLPWFPANPRVLDQYA